MQIDLITWTKVVGAALAASVTTVFLAGTDHQKVLSAEERIAVVESEQKSDNELLVRLEERQKATADDVSEVKSDVKELLKRTQGEKSGADGR